jgi:hypothetical protein
MGTVLAFSCLVENNPGVAACESDIDVYVGQCTDVKDPNKYMIGPYDPILSKSMTGNWIVYDANAANKQAAKYRFNTRISNPGFEIGIISPT